MKLPDLLKTLWSDEKRRVNLLVIMGLTGMAFLALSSFVPQVPESPARDPQPAQTDYTEELELRLEEMISLMDGAGKTSVMVTAAAGEETVYAADVSQEADGSSQTQHVLLNSDQALIETTRSPQVLGVAVVCEGGAKAEVQYQITQLVQALTDVGASHITVTKMTSQQGRGTT